MMNQENNNLFRTHKKSQFISKNNNKNIDNISLGSHIKLLFTCNKCNHDFEAIVHDVTRGNWCPYCASRKLCDNIDCTFCFEKSFILHEKSKFWSKKILFNQDVFLHLCTFKTPI